MNQIFKAISVTGLCALGLIPAAKADDYTVSDCKLAIESVVVRPPTHENTLHFYVRTRDGFDSAVSGVALVGESIYRDEDGQTYTTEFGDGKGSPLTAVPGYGDLWETDMVVTADFDVSDVIDPRITANFVVTTASGSTYTLTGKDPQTGQAAKFTFDGNMYQNIENVITGLQHLSPPQAEFAISETPSSVNAMPIHGNFPYLDPNNCAIPSGVMGAPGQH